MHIIYRLFLIVGSCFAMETTVAQTAQAMNQLNLADSLLDNGQFEKAAQHYTQILQTPLPDSLQLKALSNHAWALFKQEKDDSAHYLLQKAIHLATSTGRKEDKAELYFRTAQCWFLRGEDRKAYSTGIEATSLPASALLQGKLYNLLGNSATNLGLLEEAIAFYIKSLEEKQKSKASDLELSRTYLNLGGALDEAKKPDDALKYYLQSAQLKKAANDSAGLGRLYGNIAVVFKNRLAYKEALTYLDSSIYFNANPAAVDRYSTSTTRAQILKRMGQYHNAEHYMKIALSAAKEARNRYRTADAYINLSDLSNSSGAYQQAIHYATKADSLARETNSFTQLMHLNSNLAIAWKGLGNIARSSQYLETAYQWKDSVYNEKQLFAQEAMQMRYETTLKDKQLAEQEIILKESSFQLAQRKLIIISLILLLLLVGALFAFFQLRTKQQQLRLQQEAEKDQVKTVMRVTESERSRIAADIHDGLGQLVTSLRLQLQQQTTTEKALPLVEQLQEEIRHVAFDLMPAALNRGGLETALSEYSHFVEKTSMVPVRFHPLANNMKIPADHQVHIYRIVQEWINNVIKYASASQTDLQLSSDEHAILITIEDDGDGFDTNILTNTTGNGWTNINTRSKMIGATVLVDSHVGKKGTLFTLEIPQTAA